jgi:hypothetical protein
MPKKNKPLTLTLRALDVGKTFPAIWKGTFNRLPQNGEGRANKERVMKKMNEDLDRKIANKKAPPGFKLKATWFNSHDPRRVFLRITGIRPKIKKDSGDGGGDVTSPTPKSPPPPPQ